MGKFICFIIWMVFSLVVFFGADADIAWCVTVEEWFIGFIVWGLLILAVLWVINLFLSMLE
jgi:hypothetical protein